MTQQNSYRSIVRSTGIVGGAQFGVLLIGLVRAKLLALLIGPAGIGLFGLYNSIVTNAAAVAGMGLNTSAVREIANPAVDERTSRHAVAILACSLAGIGALVMLLLAAPLSRAIAGDASLTAAVRWLSLAVALTVAAAGVTATLQGLRRLGDLARTNILGAAVATTIAIAAVWQLQLEGLLIAVIFAPLPLLLTGLFFLRRLPRTESAAPKLAQLRREWATMLKIGGAVMVSAVIGTATQLTLRTIVLQRLGLQEVGLFQAAIAIISINLGLVLTAMAADYYPRLSQVAENRSEIEQLVAQQWHVAMLLAAPILLGLSAGAGLWLPLLYSNEFAPAADLMRWLVVADSLRLAGWVMGFVLLARRDTLSYVGVDAIYSIVTIPALLLLIGPLGLHAVGIASALGFAAALVASSVAIRFRHGVRPPLRSAAESILVTCAMVLLAVLSPVAPLPSLFFGLAAAVTAAVHALFRLRREGALPASLGSLWERFLTGRRP